VGFQFQQPFSSPATFSNVTADLVLFFSTGAPSPRPVAGILPLGDLGDPFSVCHVPGVPFCGEVFYGSFQLASNGPNPEDSFDMTNFTYRGSTDVGLNDWVTLRPVSSIGSYGSTFGPTGLPYGRPLPSNAVFYLVSSTNPVPEPETYAMLLAGLGLLGLVARRRKQKL